MGTGADRSLNRRRERKAEREAAAAFLCRCEGEGYRARGYCKREIDCKNFPSATSFPRPPPPPKQPGGNLESEGFVLAAAL